jgi:hypothetical protein
MRQRSRADLPTALFAVVAVATLLGLGVGLAAAVAVSLYRWLT